VFPIASERTRKEKRDTTDVVLLGNNSMLQFHRKFHQLLHTWDTKPHYLCHFINLTITKYT